jgi:hypothetical protein
VANFAVKCQVRIWMIYAEKWYTKDFFYDKSYEQVALQLFVSPKTVYRTIRTFLNMVGDMKPCCLGRPTTWEHNFISL